MAKTKMIRARVEPDLKMTPKQVYWAEVPAMGCATQGPCQRIPQQYRRKRWNRAIGRGGPQDSLRTRKFSLIATWQP